MNVWFFLDNNTANCFICEEICAHTSNLVERIPIPGVTKKCSHVSNTNEPFPGSVRGTPSTSPGSSPTSGALVDSDERDGQDAHDTPLHPRIGDSAGKFAAANQTNVNKRGSTSELTFLLRINDMD